MGIALYFVRNYPKAVPDVMWVDNTKTSPQANQILYHL